MGEQYTQIDQIERDKISVYRSRGWSFFAIGKKLGRNGSTISREYKRNLNQERNYLPSLAQKRSDLRKKYAGERDSKCEPYTGEIYSRLCEGWTPEQVAGRLSHLEKDFKVSHEAAKTDW